VTEAQGHEVAAGKGRRDLDRQWRSLGVGRNVNNPEGSGKDWMALNKNHRKVFSLVKNENIVTEIGKEKVVHTGWELSL